MRRGSLIRRDAIITVGAATDTGLKHTGLTNLTNHVGFGSVVP